MRNLLALAVLAAAFCTAANAQSSVSQHLLGHGGFTATNQLSPIEIANRKGSKRVGGKNSKGKGGKYVGGKPGKK